MCDLDEPRSGTAERRVELHRHHPLVVAKGSCETRVPLLLAERDDELVLVEDEGCARATLFLHCRADGGDLCGRRPTAAADQPCAEVASVRCELAEVLRSRVRVDDATTRQAREADVGKRGERFSVTAHLLECRKRREQPRAVVRADRRHVQLRETLGSLAGADAGQCLPALVERQHRDDRQVRHAADRLDRIDDLVEIVERLDREEVRAATVENRRLFCEELAPHATRRRLADRPDRSLR